MCAFDIREVCWLQSTQKRDENNSIPMRMCLSASAFQSESSKRSIAFPMHFPQSNPIRVLFGANEKGVHLNERHLHQLNSIEVQFSRIATTCTMRTCVPLAANVHRPSHQRSTTAKHTHRTAYTCTYARRWWSGANKKRTEYYTERNKTNAAEHTW